METKGIIKDLKKSERALMDVMSNPYCNQQMFDSLTVELNAIRKKIDFLMKEN